MKINETKWIVDSGFSRHMTINASSFNKLKTKDGEKVIFGIKKNAKTIGIGDIGTQDSSLIKIVLLVDNLNYNLLSVSQLCDMGLNVRFKKFECIFLDEKCNVVAKDKRVNDIYIIDLKNMSHGNVMCLNVVNEDAWLWHRRLWHFYMDLQNEISKTELVRGLPSSKYAKDKICDA